MAQIFADYPYASVLYLREKTGRNFIVDMTLLVLS
jgi:hypothetical protein